MHVCGTFTTFLLGVAFFAATFAVCSAVSSSDPSVGGLPSDESVRLPPGWGGAVIEIEVKGEEKRQAWEPLTIE